MRRKNNCFYIILIVIISAMMMISCRDKSKEDNVEVEEKLDKEQFVSLFIGAEPKSLDPSRSNDVYSDQVLLHIMDGLTRVESSEDGDKIVPGIAEKWEVSEDETKWTFYLRSAKWSDGKPITAGDFRFGILRTLDPKTKSEYAWFLESIIKNATSYRLGEKPVDEVGVKAINDYTLEISLEHPVSYFLSMTHSKIFYPQREDMIQQFGESYGIETQQILSTGAFVLQEWNHSEKFVLKKNPSYWNAGKIKLGKIEMKILKDEEARMNALRTGAVDIAPATLIKWKEKFTNSGNFNYYSADKPSVVYEMFNQKNKFLKNTKIRKALTVAVDREGVNKALYRNNNTPARSWVPPAVKIGTELYREKANSSPVKDMEDEIRDPKALLVEGLKEIGESGDPSKMEITLIQSGTTARARDFAETEQQRLQSMLGITVNIEYYEWPVFSDKILKGEYDIATRGWGADYNDPMSFFEPFTNKSSSMKTYWNNPKFQSLIKEAGVETNNEKRFELFKEAERILLYEDAVVSPWVFRKSSLYSRKFVKEINISSDGLIDVTKAYTAGRNR